MPKLFAAVFSLLLGFTFVIDFWRWVYRRRRSKRLDYAIAIIKRSQDSHVSWAKTDQPRPTEVGPPSFHQNCIERYDHVLGVLRGCREERKP